MSGRSENQTTPKRGDVRYDYHGPIRVLCGADGWLLVRRPRAGTWAMTVKDWDKLATAQTVVGTSLAPRAMHYGVLA